MKKIILLTLILFVSACSTDDLITNHGSMPSEEKISQLQYGDSKNEVLNLLGSPSSVSSLDKNTWIYMSSKTKQFAFFNPEIISRDILIIKFNNKGEVFMAEREDLSAGKEIVISQDKTGSGGSEEGFFEKAFGTLKPNVAQ